MGDIHSIYAKTYQFVYLRAKSILEKEDDAQQLMKEVYLKAAKSTSLREDNLYAWLGKRTYVLGCQKYRKRKAREVEIIELADNEYRMSDNVDSEKTIEVMTSSMEQLPDMYQATLFALYFDHMKIKDISTVMGYSVGAIVNRINYIHKYFKKAIEIAQESVRTKMRFSVETVKETVDRWALSQTMSTVSAQNLYVAICKELGEEVNGSLKEGQRAGCNRRVVECDSNELQVVFGELGTYRTKPFLDKRRLTILGMAAGILALLILLGIWIFGGDSEEKSSGTNTDSNIQTETKPDVDVNIDETEPDVEQDSENEEESNEDEQANSEYVLPNSDTVRLTRSDLEGLSAQELRIARNELFARYGTIFGAADLKEYFAGKSWYNPRMTFDEFDDTIDMNEIEKANLSLILEVEEEIAQ